ncbi:MAG TPA: tRNA (adenosine(37)-N6)-dimethylallyltransferase MiaA [Syntrophales bacterium]|nr:tRNA (adenosine(37)-N6)-dimethylallyltransferase MiaA [Syntrophales bacterium]HOM06437.1 tRNA (adenosine(37)-N6)-dimethylallyltransferase MiaA [Syntrophales bacterium]HON99112.1 tRNA (adenosine(37)-N6)-dimethylallyltransferase MiaA [Syntrophales bacterium]HPC00220.1 tRNA (adenosine(37)-N6)-dimethylallyltransferase MiaA [Syntrophales bacterium]HPQ05883.1 tRNA (adenosine(37)-N6)-dimethylallyltransferase MiaA [Syntrophales bacterium]
MGPPGGRLVVLTGPTASGKTQLACELAAELGGEIISADSMQVYRGLDIGTAKPPREVREAVPHHLIDVADPDEDYNAARFAREARRAIEDLGQRGKAVFVVGGTGLYIRALLGGIFPGPGSDEGLRRHYRELARQGGTGYLHSLLAARDGRAAARIHPHDEVRVIRALEVLALTGRSIVDSQEAHGFRNRPYEVLVVALGLERQELYRRIEERSREMVRAGLLEETRGLLSKGYGPHLKPLQGLGYRHMISHLRGEMDLEAAVNLLIRDTRRYAKRQVTWLRSEEGVTWFHRTDRYGITRKILDFLRSGL